MSRSSKHETAATAYTTCPFCLGQHVKSNDRKHILKCGKKHGEQNTLQGQLLNCIMGKSIELKVHTTANDVRPHINLAATTNERTHWIKIVQKIGICIGRNDKPMHNIVKAI